MQNIHPENGNFNPTDLKITTPSRRFLHQQPGINGLGKASVFARDAHKVAPGLYRRRWA